MNYENVLLIGGPKDGERVSVEAGIPHLRFVQMQPPPVSYRDNANPDQDQTIDEVIYRRHPVQSAHGLKTAVFVFGDIDPLAALIDGYRPAAGREVA
ncbi:hypothetical protein [Pseudomonas graminis]|uniref:Uncharacterized protein n=1 Tax=Pseudomonas graminis TaxID=158627 RepID=A0A1I0GZK4_9PSED|nr:hypothetical protein [Pseudomonas graminis]SET76651.1 hypothetical protein SAMN05216197_12465 [Pseudomonas graminis]